MLIFACSSDGEEAAEVQMGQTSIEQGEVWGRGAGERGEGGVSGEDDVQVRAGLGEDLFDGRKQSRLMGGQEVGDGGGGGIGERVLADVCIGGD